MSIYKKTSTIQMLSLALLLGGVSVSRINSMAISHPLMHTIDGFNISKIVGCHDRIRSVRLKNYSRSPDVTITLEDLVTQSETLSPEQLARLIRQLITSLVNMMEDEGYLQEFAAIQSIFDELIPKWAEERNRPQTVLRAFTDQSKTVGAECDILCEKITTLRAYHEFLVDLEAFLGDIIASCPKSMATYTAAINSLRQ